MLATPLGLPGLEFTRAAVRPEPSPLRSDVAGFAGRTRRGPLGVLVRVEGWKDYLRIFGGLDARASTTYALRGYFDNGGEVAHVVRLAPAALPTAKASLDPKQPVGNDTPATALAEVPSGFAHATYELRASSPGDWAEGMRVRIDYRRRGAAGFPELDLAIAARGEPPEYVGRVRADLFAEQLAQRSALLRAVPGAGLFNSAVTGPAALRWDITLGTATESPPGAAEYGAAFTQLLDEAEIALLAFPDFHQLPDGPDTRALLATLIEAADTARDRLVLLDAPSERDAVAWLGAMRQATQVLALRSAALYHPWLEVPDPLGGPAHPVRAVPPSGHVAGVVSRLDRERGAAYTPANAPIFDAVDLAPRLAAERQLELHGKGVNLLRCIAGRGLQVWGGSTLAREPFRNAGRSTPFVANEFLSYRRLIHRLVRAIRRVAEPLVFDTNGPALWLQLVRAVTSVLLEAWRHGGLQGSRPEEAFRVTCDEKTNPPEERDLGRCVCEIAIAPVAPMEFIVLRVALGGEGKLEVFEP
jgi:hypothetical protein